MVKKIFKILFYLFVTATIFVSLGLAVEANKSLVCNSFVVNIDHSCGNFFIEAEQIKNEVYRAFDSIPGQELKNINTNKIEKLISGIMYVKSADVYKTIDGTVRADIKQRKPLARVINSYGNSFYIDTGGKLMPLSKEYTARVIVVTGEFKAGYSPLVDLSMPLDDEFSENDQMVLKDVYELTTYIDSHPLLNAFIDHIVVNSKREFELIPKNGVHIIELGNLSRMEQKLNKLLVFYKHGLTKLGWSKYNRVNLKYKNQVVCVN